MLFEMLYQGQKCPICRVDHEAGEVHSEDNRQSPEEEQANSPSI